LEQQTATSEILGVISSSPTDAQPVFNAIARSAMRLCEGAFSVVARYDGELMHLGAHAHTTAEGTNYIQQNLPKRPGRETMLGRAILGGQVVHVSDLQADIEYNPASQQAHRVRSGLSVPMLLDGRPVGAISVGRHEVRPFTEQQIELLQTFASQAVIAIENVRLFNELQTSNQELTTSLDKQTATSDILRVISQSPTDVQPVFDAIVQSAVRLSGAIYGNVYKVNGGEIHLVAHHNLMPEQLAQWQQQYPRPVSGSGAVPRAIRTGTVGLTADWEADSEWAVPSAGVQAAQRARGVRSILIVPMFRQQEVIGAIGLTHREVAAFTNAHVELLQTFADQAVIAIENVRLFKELETKNRDLTTALDQQTATAEILRVISSSPTDLQPVFDAIVQSAGRLCDAEFGVLQLFDGERLTLDAHYGISPEDVAIVQKQVFPMRPDRGSGLGRAILTRAVVHIQDIRSDPEYRVSVVQALEGFRTVLTAPMLRGDVPIGVLSLLRREVRPFAQTEIEMVQNFAVQAVIAIQNFRPYKELQASNRELTTALAKQTATAEILRIISTSPTDLQPVLDAVVTSVARLCGAYDVVMFRLIGSDLQLAAHYGPLSPLTGFVLPLVRGTVLGRSVLERRPIQVADAQAEADEFPEGSAAARELGVRTILGVPLLSQNEVLGTIGLWRAEADPFTAEQIALLQTFADQCVIAIENVRLFKELEARTADLTRSVGQLTALGEVGQAVSSSLDLETVLTTIVSRAVQLSGLDGGVIFEYDETTAEFAQRATLDPAGALAEARRTTPI